jgi:hypothetical protein
MASAKNSDILKKLSFIDYFCEFHKFVIAFKLSTTQKADELITMSHFDENK